jgi:hypothetical protein
MREILHDQLRFGEVDISEIKADYKSRDEIDKTIIGLKYIYTNDETRESVFKILEKITPINVSKKTGRPGMELWKIFVLGVLRQVCNWDYDKLQNQANNHLLIRQLLGHSESTTWSSGYYYELQTIKDNVSLLTDEILQEINLVVVQAGHKLLSKKKRKI